MNHGVRSREWAERAQGKARRGERGGQGEGEDSKGKVGPPGARDIPPAEPSRKRRALTPDQLFLHSKSEIETSVQFSSVQFRLGLELELGLELGLRGAGLGWAALGLEGAALAPAREEVCSMVQPRCRSGSLWRETR